MLERDRIDALGLGIEIVDPFSLGLDSLLEQGVDFLSAEIESDLRACRELGLERATVPPDFPLAWADKLRGAGIELTVDAEAFDLRRRRKIGGADRGHPPRPGGRRRRHGRRRVAAARAARTG